MAVRDLIYQYTENKSMISQGLALYQQGQVQHIKINSVDYDPGSTLAYSSTIIADAEVGDEHPFLVMRADALLSFGCTCTAGHDSESLCSHLVGLVRALSDMLVPTEAKMDMRAVDDLLHQYAHKEEFSPNGVPVTKGRASLIPTLDFDPYRNYYSLEFHIAGPQKSYIIKSISTFYNYMQRGETFAYGKQLNFCHKRENFDEPSQFYLDLIENAFEWMNYGRKNTYDSPIKVGRYLHLTHNQFDQLFEHIANHGNVINAHYPDGSTGPLRLMLGAPETTVQVLSRSDDEFLLGVTVNDYKIYHNNNIGYLLGEKLILRPGEGYQKYVIPLIESVMKADGSLLLDGPRLTTFLGLVAPSIASFVNLEIENELYQKYAPNALRIHLILDYPQQNTIRGRMTFAYGDTVFNPLSDDAPGDELLRDTASENKFAALLTQYRFSVNEDEWLLVGEDAIYTFLYEGLPELMPLAEIDIEDTLSHMKPKSFQLPQMKVSVGHGILELKFDESVYSKEILVEVLTAYRAGKKFIRLTDDTYIDIINPQVQQIDTLMNDCDISLKELLDEDELSLPLYRAVTLDAFNEDALTPSLDRHASFQKLIDQIQNGSNMDDIEPPDSLCATLRPYQLTGYRWLMRLANLGFGGILADDMGLGKTLQTIAYLLKRHEDNPKARAIIVMPTSLIYNWESELARFAPSLDIRIVTGSKKERTDLLTDVPEGTLILTSYATLRRDAALYEQYHFDSIISDEGQYIKNSYTQNTKSLKSLRGDHHFALTGTPIENSLADLWSILDFCMPGYLHSWREFRNLYEVPITRYEDDTRLNQLKRQIAPFILRRVKNEVLTELPDKIDTVLYANFSEEERRIYHAQLALSHKTFIEEIASSQVGQSRIRVLTLLMRLRQVCCSPALFLEDYKKESAKLSLCLSVIEDRISAGSQMLVFSQFTSVLDLIAPELEKRGIPYLMLTGSTKSKDRMDLVNQFNEEKIPVFLISLKAGGVGLNLTSADTVIHFDPWWNQSVENQATDRTHRIGQKKSVHVIRLITKDTIEEKILRLKERKQALSDAVITSDASVLAALTMDDLHDLFALDYAGTIDKPIAPRPTHAPYTMLQNE